MNDQNFSDILRDKIDLKDAEFQRYVGMCYFVGDGGIEVNHTEAAKWYKLAAEQGHSDAQYLFGHMLEFGYGDIDKNLEEAFKWYERAAERGNDDSQRKLADKYYYVTQDYDKAFEWYSRVGDNHKLGDMCYEGKTGKQPDFEKAKEYYEKALAETKDASTKKDIQNKIDEINQKFEDEKKVAVALKTERTEVFVSYSHKDTEYKDELEPFLKMLKNTTNIEWWDDSKIKSGEQWRDEINKALSKAKVAVLMISANFFASDFIIEEELPDILEAADEKGTTILWVLVSTCSYKGTAVEKYQAMNDPKIPLARLKEEEDRNEVYTKVVDRIKEIFNTKPKSSI